MKYSRLSKQFGKLLISYYKKVSQLKGLSNLKIFNNNSKKPLTFNTIEFISILKILYKD
jgi:hypothetical protein